MSLMALELCNMFRIFKFHQADNTLKVFINYVIGNACIIFLTNTIDSCISFANSPHFAIIAIALLWNSWMWLSHRKITSVLINAKIAGKADKEGTSDDVEDNINPRGNHIGLCRLVKPVTSRIFCQVMHAGVSLALVDGMSCPYRHSTKHKDVQACAHIMGGQAESYWVTPALETVEYCDQCITHKHYDEQDLNGAASWVKFPTQIFDCFLISPKNFPWRHEYKESTYDDNGEEVASKLKLVLIEATLSDVSKTPLHTISNKREASLLFANILQQWLLYLRIIHFY